MVTDGRASVLDWIDITYPTKCSCVIPQADGIWMPEETLE
jgi:hypothetical protein